MFIVKKGKLLCINEKYHLVYKSGMLFFYDNFSRKEIYSYSLYGTIMSVLSKVRLFERFFRLEARCAVSIAAEEFLVSCHGKVFYINVERKQVVIEHQYRHDMNNPLDFCVYKKDEQIAVLYGEYGWNTEKGEVGIWRRFGNGWKKVISFPEKSITHIHQLVYDKYRDEYLIATGDTDEESGIWRLDVQFQEISPVLVGNQQYRACSIFPVKDGFIYATDTPIADNYLYFYSYRDDTLSSLYHMPGPCIYSTVINGVYYFATSVEPDSTLSKWQYRFTYKLGKGIMDSFVHIIAYKEGGIEEVAKFKKDFWPMWFFQFGNCQFPRLQIATKCLYLTPVAVYNYDNKTIKI